MSIEQSEGEHAPDLAKAKANRTYITHYLKSCHALLYAERTQYLAEHGIKASVEDKKMWAYAHPDYLEQLKALQIAVEEEELHNFKMKAAEALAEVWRTESANNRMTDRSHQ